MAKPHVKRGVPPRPVRVRSRAQALRLASISGGKQSLVRPRWKRVCTKPGPVQAGLGPPEQVRRLRPGFNANRPVARFSSARTGAQIQRRSRYILAMTRPSSRPRLRGRRLRA
jgi:hypothetical protein